MSSNDDFYRRLAGTLRHLGGGRVTVDEAMAHMPVSCVEASRAQGMFGDTSGLDVREVMRRGQLSGTHEVRHTMRGAGWEAQGAPAGQEFPYRFVGEDQGARPVSMWSEEALRAQGVIIVE